MRTLITVLLLFPICLQAQKEELPKYGKIEPAIFSKTAYSLDSSAPAVILLDFGRTEIVGNRKGWFSMRHLHRRRIHILDKKGYDHASEVVSLYKDADGEALLESLKCTTYNLEGDKVVEAKLEKSQVFEEQVDRNRKRVRFTAPAVKEGSVVEYEYVLVSDFYFSLVPWNFQGSIPRLWSEYQFNLPSFMDYRLFSQGYFPFHIKDQKEKSQHFRITEQGEISQQNNYSFTTGVTEYRWVMKDVPVLKEEQFTSTLDNHIARIEFQLAGYKDPLVPRSIMTTWPETAKALMERDDFGKLINANNGFLDDVVQPLVKDAFQPEDRVRKIYAFVRDNFSCTDSRSLIAEQNLRTVLRNSKGNVSELNLLLVALLRHAGFQADPVILSTRENGYTYPLYPMINRYNYVVAEVQVNGRPVFLDASKRNLAFGKLPAYCYNGSGRLLDLNVQPVEFLPDSLVEHKSTFVFMGNSNGKYQGGFSQVPGYYQSLEIRDVVREKGKEHFEKEFASELGPDFIVSGVDIDSLQNPDAQLKYKANVEIKIDGQDILYINPLLEDVFLENPFKAANRY